MKKITHILAATTFVAAAAAFSSAASAATIDFDIGDVPNTGYPVYFPDNYNYFWRDTPGQPGAWDWVERYFSEQLLVSGLSDKWALPELTGPRAQSGIHSSTGNVLYPGSRGPETTLSFNLQTGYSIVFDWEASWVGFENGSQYSFNSMYDMSNRSYAADGGADGNSSVTGFWRWYWAESPLGAAMPTHVHLAFQPLGVGPTPAVPEPETYAMLLAGLGLVGFVARRRRHLARR
jgi:hypothetical protein